MVSIAQSSNIHTVKELIERLNNFKTGDGSTNYINLTVIDGDTIIQTDSEPVRIDLVKTVLSDNSEVFNILISAQS